MRRKVEKGRGSQRSPRPIGAFIDPAWRSMSRANADLHRDLGSVLGPYLDSGRARIAMAGNTLVIACRERTSALEIRFLLRDLRKTLDAHGRSDTENLRVVLESPDACEGRGLENPGRQAVPESAAGTLLSAADDVRDPRLSAALRRLARLGSRDPIIR